MKLRIKGDSVRLRLTRSEVATLLASGIVQERTSFPDGAAFVYRVIVDAAVSEIGAALAGSTLTVRLPSAAAQRWSRDTVVGLEYALGLRSGGELRVLVEKDFACAHPRAGENIAELFPHPTPGQCDGHGGDGDGGA